MDNIKPSETLDENGVISKDGSVENPCDRTRKETSRLLNCGENHFGSLLIPDDLAGRNGDRVDSKTGCMRASRVEVSSKKIDSEKWSENVESITEDIQAEGVQNEHVLVANRIAMVKDGKNGDAPQLDEFLPDAKADASENGISLFVDVFGLPDEFIQRNETVLGGNVEIGSNYNHVFRDNGSLMFDNVEDPSAEVSEVHNSVFGFPQIGNMNEETKGGYGTDVLFGENYKFSLGDLVWVKTKTKSWWPGLIIDPADSPKDAIKSDLRASFLVKYFGHASYIWCSHLQLKPFVENFELLSTQGKSRSFLGSLEKAVDEYGRRVKVQMTCSCNLQENRAIPVAPWTGSDGSKKGSLLQETQMHERGENFLTQFNPINFLGVVRFLAWDVSVPNMLELAAIRNRLSAFYGAIGHCQLPMHQLRQTTDDVDSAENGFSKKGKRSSFKNKIRDKESEIIYASREVTGGDNDGGSGVKSEKGYESRERRRSKYLSYPYVNVDWSSKNTPVPEENAANDEAVSLIGQSINSVVGQSAGSPPIVKCSGKKLPKKSSKKETSGCNTPLIPGDLNASLGDLLSELRFSAVDCLYPNECTNFDSVDRIFSGFRRWVFHDKYNPEMDGEHQAGGNSNHEFDTQEPFGAEPFADMGDVDANTSDPDSSHSLPVVTFKRKGRKEKVAKSVCTSSSFDVNGVLMNGSFVINFQEPGNFGPHSAPLPKKRRKKSGKVPEHLQAQIAVELPDLNGNSFTQSSLIGNLQAKPVQNKRQKKEGASLMRSRTKSVSRLVNMNVNYTAACSFLKDVQVMGPCSTQYISKLNEGNKGDSSLHLNSEITADQRNNDGNNIYRSSFVKDTWVMGLLAPSSNSETKKRKRKEKTMKDETHPAIPDLNGNAVELNSSGKFLPEMNSTPTEGKPKRKRRRRNKTLNPLTDGEANGNALILTFAQGFPVPSREALVATFCGFGPLNESETRSLSDSRSAMVVFNNSSDAVEALKSLEKSSPFGPVLVNFRLNHLSPVSMPCGLKANPKEAPDLAYIRKNLEMMTSILEKAGNNLSPDMRVKLENDVKGLLKKVSTMVGSSSSS